MNRQNRRHPTHPALPPLQESKKRILDKPVKKKKVDTTPRKTNRHKTG